MSFELVAEPFFHYIYFFFIFSMPIFIILYGELSVCPWITSLGFKQQAV